MCSYHALSRRCDVLACVPRVARVALCSGVAVHEGVRISSRECTFTFVRSTCTVHGQKQSSLPYIPSLPINKVKYRNLREREGNRGTCLSVNYLYDNITASDILHIYDSIIMANIYYERHHTNEDRTKTSKTHAATVYAIRKSDHLFPMLLCSCDGQ